MYVLATPLYSWSQPLLVFKGRCVAWVVGC